MSIVQKRWITNSCVNQRHVIKGGVATLVKSDPFYPASRKLNL